MMLDEIIKSCGNMHIAEAAVRSIGISFAEEVRLSAEERGLSLGAFAAATVRRFDREAPPDVRQALLRTIRRTDQPILAGLRFIVGYAMQQEDGAPLARHRFAAAREAGASSCLC
jgi:hypothetical protein